jgi:hypothetical protein
MNKKRIEARLLEATANLGGKEPSWQEQAYKCMEYIQTYREKERDFIGILVQPFLSQGRLPAEFRPAQLAKIPLYPNYSNAQQRQN